MILWERTWNIKETFKNFEKEYEDQFDDYRAGYEGERKNISMKN